jgi:hypothetical protein
MCLFIEEWHRHVWNVLYSFIYKECLGLSIVPQHFVGTNFTNNKQEIRAELESIFFTR